MLNQSELEVIQVLGSNHNDIWGTFWNHRDKAIFVGNKLTVEKRQSIVSILSSLSVVFFLAGLDRETYKNDPNLLQRVLAYGGTLDNWEWALGTGDWKKHYIICTNGQDVLGYKQN